MENYQLKLDKIINCLETKPRLALHSCCGPCSSYVLTYLMEYFDITLFFYNPNVHPETEYQKRLDEQLRLCQILGVKTYCCDYDTDRFFAVSNGLENEREGGARCTECFKLRLDYTARLAKEQGFDMFATTLTVSPHKNAQLINEIGEAVSKKYNLPWLPSDFKKRNGYLNSIRLSQKYELYRQNYCGCVYSMGK